MVKLLAVVLIELETGIRADITIDTAKRVVLRGLLHRAVLTDHRAVVAEMVLQIVMKRSLTVLERTVAAVEEELVENGILKDERTAELRIAGNSRLLPPVHNVRITAVIGCGVEYDAAFFPI